MISIIDPEQLPSISCHVRFLYTTFFSNVRQNLLKVKPKKVVSKHPSNEARIPHALQHKQLISSHQFSVVVCPYVSVQLNCLAVQTLVAGIYAGRIVLQIYGAAASKVADLWDRLTVGFIASTTD